MSYDPLGRLFEVAVNGAVATRFLYDGDALVAEYDGSGAMQKRHVHWVGADVPAITYQGATLADPLYLFADRQGSIVALADGSGTTNRDQPLRRRTGKPRDETMPPLDSSRPFVRAALRVTLPLLLALALDSCRYDFRVATNPTPDGPRFSIGSAVSTLPRPGPRCVHSVIVYRDNSRQPIWMIERVSDCPSVATFVYGFVPSGWRERIAAAPLEAGVYYVAIAGSGSGGGARFSADGTPARYEDRVVRTGATSPGDHAPGPGRLR